MKKLFGLLLLLFFFTANAWSEEVNYRYELPYNIIDKIYNDNKSELPIEIAQFKVDKIFRDYEENYDVKVYLRDIDDLPFSNLEYKLEFKLNSKKKYSSEYSIDLDLIRNFPDFFSIEFSSMRRGRFFAKSTFPDLNNNLLSFSSQFMGNQKLIYINGKNINPLYYIDNDSSLNSAGNMDDVEDYYEFIDIFKGIYTEEFLKEISKPRVLLFKFLNTDPNITGRCTNNAVAKQIKELYETWTCENLLNEANKITKNASYNEYEQPFIENIYSKFLDVLKDKYGNLNKENNLTTKKSEETFISIVKKIENKLEKVIGLETSKGNFVNISNFKYKNSYVHVHARLYNYEKNKYKSFDLKYIVVNPSGEVSTFIRKIREETPKMYSYESKAVYSDTQYIKKLNIPRNFFELKQFGSKARYPEEIRDKIINYKNLIHINEVEKKFKYDGYVLFETKNDINRKIYLLEEWDTDEWNRKTLMSVTMTDDKLFPNKERIRGECLEKKEKGKTCIDWLEDLDNEIKRERKNNNLFKKIETAYTNYLNQ